MYYFDPFKQILITIHYSLCTCRSISVYIYIYIFRFKEVATHNLGQNFCDIAQQIRLSWSLLLIGY